MYVEEIAALEECMRRRIKARDRQLLHMMAEAAIVPNLKPNEIQKFFRDLESQDSEDSGGTISKDDLHKNLAKLKKLLKEGKA